jgi:hypothetical protein
MKVRSERSKSSESSTGAAISHDCFDRYPRSTTTTLPFSTASAS